MLATIGRTQQQPLLTGNKQCSGQIEDVVKVERSGVIDSVADGPPVLAAILGGECKPISAQDEAMLVVKEVYGQERLVRPLLEQHLR
ncbi:hypothetical protein D9M70_481210 [compost metagenome]